MNKMTKDDLAKKKEEFSKFMDGIENLNFFNDENNKEINKENDNKNDNKDRINAFNNSDMNLLVKSLIFIFSRKMNSIEDKININVL